MKRLSIFATLLLIACISCTRSDSNMDITTTGHTIYASIDKQTRTVMGEDYSVLWSQGDEIGVFNSKGTGNVFSLTSGAGTPKGVFQSLEELPDADAYFALYPVAMYQSARYFTDNTIVYFIDLPADKVFAEKSFVTDSNPMYAISTDKNNMEFKNLCGIVEFQLVGTGKVDRISISSKDNPLAGVFYTNPDNFELVFYEEPKYAITGTLETPILLSETPRSVYAVLPTGSYTGLQVTVSDQWGVNTTLTATNTITVSRSKITTVSNFTHSGFHEEATVPAVRIVETGSSFVGTSAVIYFNNLCSGYKSVSLTKSRYQQLKEQGNTDLEILNSHTSSVRDFIQEYTYSNNVVIAMPVDKEGNDYTEGLIVKEITADPIPYDNTLSVEMENIVVGETTFSATLKSNISGGTFIHTQFNWLAQEEEIGSLAYTGYSVHTASEGNSVEISNDSENLLIPDTEYTIHYTVTDAVVDTEAYIPDWMQGMYHSLYTRYAPRQSYTFRTLKHTPSEATVSFANGNIGEFSATFDVVLSQGATKWRYLFLEQPLDTTSLTLLADYMHSKAGVCHNCIDSTESSVSFSNLKYNTKYYIYAIAYDSNDSYGGLCSFEFTTLPLQEVEDERYDQYLGTYLVTPDRATEPQRVTISQNVKGRMFNISGLGSTTLAGTYDDTITAWFYDGVLSIPCQNIPNILEVYLLNDFWLWYNTDLNLNGTYNSTDNTISFSSEGGGKTWTGIRITQPGVATSYTNLVLTKEQEQKEEEEQGNE